MPKIIRGSRLAAPSRWMQAIALWAVLGEGAAATPPELTADVATYCYAAARLQLAEDTSLAESSERIARELANTPAAGAMASTRKKNAEQIATRNQQVYYFLGAADATRPGFLSSSEASRFMQLATRDAREMADPNGKVRRCGQSCNFGNTSDWATGQACLEKCVGESAAFLRVRACSRFFPYIERSMPGPR
jgi:hypothetical protein